MQSTSPLRRLREPPRGLKTIFWFERGLMRCSRRIGSVHRPPRCVSEGASLQSEPFWRACWAGACPLLCARCALRGQVLDTDKSGVLSSHEFTAAMRKLVPMRRGGCGGGAVVKHEIAIQRDGGRAPEQRGLFWDLLRAIAVRRLRTGCGCLILRPKK